MILYDFPPLTLLLGPVVLIILGLSPFELVVRWKCINLDSLLQYKALFEESPLVKPQRQGDSDENEGERKEEETGASHSSAFSPNRLAKHANESRVLRVCSRTRSPMNFTGQRRRPTAVAISALLCLCQIWLTGVSQDV